MDEGSNRAVRTMFKRLYDDGLIYRAERMVNWSPALRSVLSDIEVEHKEVDGELVSIRYGDGDDSVVVATTRVETMLGDTAVAVHPDDERYRHLVGRRDRAAAGRAPDPDPRRRPRRPGVRHRRGQGHSRARPQRLRDRPPARPADADDHGRDAVSSPAPAPSSTAWTGSRRASRSARRCGRRAGSSRRSARTGTASATPSARQYEPIEPRLSLQWFVKVGPLAKAAGDAVRERATSSSTPRSSSRAGSPGWTTCTTGASPGSCGGATGSRSGTGRPARSSACGPGRGAARPAGRQDDDVLDTWFSSGLWPFSTLGWPDDTADLRRYYPTSVLVTGYDILFFWVARMMMFGLYAMDGEPPFDTIALHGMVRDEHGKKMSKSAGNTVDPHRVDGPLRHRRGAVRAGPRREPGHGHAARRRRRRRRAQLHHQAVERHPLRAGQRRDGRAAAARRGRATDADRWILGRLREVRAQVDALLEDFQFAKATEALYHFTWGEFCDWYVELAKPQLARRGTARGHPCGARARPGRAAQAAAPGRAVHHRDAVDGADRRRVGGHRARGRSRSGAPVDAAAATRIVDLQKLVTEVRRFRTEQGIPDSRRVAARVVGARRGRARATALRSLARLDAPGRRASRRRPRSRSCCRAARSHVELDTSGAIDVAAERARLGRDLAAAQKELDAAEKKLGNPKFVDEGARRGRRRHPRRAGEAAVADIERVTARLAALPS